jgi:hypothetical protein
MRVTITRKPVGAVRGMWLVSLQVGQTYNLKDDVARALLNGFAIEEHRFGERRRARRDESPGRRQTDSPHHGAA